MGKTEGQPALHSNQQFYFYKIFDGKDACKITGGPAGWKNPGPPPQILSTGTPCYILRASFLPLKKLPLLKRGVNQGKKWSNGCRYGFILHNEPVPLTIFRLNGYFF
jgi:hypothetical protein